MLSRRTRASRSSTTHRGASFPRCGDAPLKGERRTADHRCMVARIRSLPDCRPLLADPDDLTVVFGPVVDLARGVVAGYQAGARFPGTAGPGVWLAAAADAGLAAEVEALFVHRALARLPWVPGG